MLFCGYWLNGFLEIGKKLTLNQIFYIGMAFVLLFAMVLLFRTFKGFPRGFIKNCNALKTYIKTNKIKKKNLKSVYGLSKNVSKELYKGLKAFRGSTSGNPSDYISKEKVLKSRSSSKGFIFGFIFYMILAVAVTAFLSISYHNNLGDGITAGIKIPAIVFGAILVLGVLQLLIRKAQLKKSNGQLKKLIKFLDKKLGTAESGESQTQTEQINEVSESNETLKSEEEIAQNEDFDEHKQESKVDGIIYSEELDVDSLQNENDDNKELDTDSLQNENDTDLFESDDLESMLDGMLKSSEKSNGLIELNLEEKNELENLLYDNSDDDVDSKSSEDILNELISSAKEFEDLNDEEKNGESYKNTSRIVKIIDPNEADKDFRPYSEEKLKKKLESLGVDVDNIENEETEQSQTQEIENEVQSSIENTVTTEISENEEVYEEKSFAPYENENQIMTEIDGETNSDNEIDSKADDYYKEISNDNEESFENDVDNVSDDADEEKLYDFIDAMSGNDGSETIANGEDFNQTYERLNSDLVDLLNAGKTGDEENITKNDFEKYPELLSKKVDLDIQKELENAQNNIVEESKTVEKAQIFEPEQVEEIETASDLNAETVENEVNVVKENQTENNNLETEIVETIEPEEVVENEEIESQEEPFRAEDMSQEIATVNVANKFHERKENSSDDTVNEFISSERHGENSFDEQNNLKENDEIGEDNENQEYAEKETDDLDSFSDFEEDLSSEFDDILNSVETESVDNVKENETKTENINLDASDNKEIANQNEENVENSETNNVVGEKSSNSSQEPVEENKTEINTNATDLKESKLLDRQMTFDKVDESEDKNSEVIEEVNTFNEPYIFTDYNYDQLQAEYQKKRKQKPFRQVVDQVSYLTTINVDPVSKKKSADEENQANSETPATGVDVKLKSLDIETNEKVEKENTNVDLTENDLEEKDLNESTEITNSQDDDIAEIVGKFKDIQTNKGFVPEKLSAFNDEDSSANEAEETEDKVLEENEYVTANVQNTSDDFSVQSLDDDFSNQGLSQDVSYRDSFSDFDDLFVSPEDGAPMSASRNSGNEENFDDYYNKYASKVNNPNLTANYYDYNQNNPQNNSMFNGNNVGYNQNSYNQYQNNNFGYNQMQNNQNIYNQSGFMGQNYYQNVNQPYNQNGYYPNQNMYNQNGFMNQNYQNGYYPNQPVYPNNVNGYNQGYYPNQQFMGNQMNNQIGGSNYPNQNFQNQGMFAGNGYNSNQNQAYQNMQGMQNTMQNGNAPVQNLPKQEAPANSLSTQMQNNNTLKGEGSKPVQKAEETTKTEQKIEEKLANSQQMPEKVEENVVEIQEIEKPLVVEKVEEKQPENVEIVKEKQTESVIEEKPSEKTEKTTAKKSAKKTKVKEEKPSSDFKTKKETQEENEPVVEKKSNRGRPKSISIEDNFVITTEAEFEKALARAEKLTRKKDSNLSVAQAKRVETELEKLMKALNEYRNKEN